MIMKKRFIKTFLTICTATMLMMPFAACDTTPSATVKSVDTGSTWEVTETTNLSELTIADSATIKAPDGYLVTMTVNHIETGIEPGSYEGEIVLTPTEDIIRKDSMHGEICNLRTAIYVNNGAVVPEKSVSAAVAGGTVTDDSATDVSITSIGENFNGIIATGDSTYSINNPKFNLTGHGGNDFAGYGAAITTAGNADVTVNNASIITNGSIRTAVWVGGESTIHVNDSYIETGSPPLPEGHLDPFTEGGTVMREVPFMLGMTGTCRATNLLDSGTAYYTNSHIKAQGWGALSIDAVTNTKMFATKCLIETVESGYGAFTLGENISTFSECTFNVTDIGMISQDGDSVFTDSTVVNSGRFGVMYHGSGDVTIDKGSVFNTKSTAIQMKSPDHNIVVDNAQLNPENGIIIQTMANDDPNMAGRGRREGGMPEGEMPEGGIPGGAPGGGFPADGGIPDGGRSGGSNDTKATFSNVILNGDIIHGDTYSGAMDVNFENATITGAITTATIKHALGPNGEEITMQTPELYYLIGEVSNIFGATDDPI
ncbi:right-handed parallel beta-helix repeat-containing protein, partial [Deltaproteobacteria bacterium]|nr:right-handed parallel beta-helix repeat-containing protein [Deltaproteobacteria bacterium]